MKIEIPDEAEPIDCLTRIVRVQEQPDGKNYDIAVCFLDITSAMRSRLDNYVEAELKSRGQ
jgi:hypothetical protein